MVYGVREGSPVEVQLTVRWVGGKDLWKQVSFKSGMEEREVMDGVMLVTDGE